MKSWKIATAAFIGFVLVLGYGVTQRVRFYYGVTAHIELAVAASTTDLAITQLEPAVTYLERNGMMQGNTSLLIQAPRNDVGYWYQNLRQALDEFKALDADATPVDRSNMLLKFRETAMEQNEEGKEVVRKPAFIHIHPHRHLNLILLVVFATTVIMTGGRGIVQFAYKMS